MSYACAREKSEGPGSAYHVLLYELLFKHFIPLIRKCVALSVIKLFYHN